MYAKWKDNKVAGIRAAYYAALQISQMIKRDLAEMLLTHAEPYYKTISPERRSRLDLSLKAMSDLVSVIHIAAEG